MNTKRKGIYKILIILTTIVCLLNGCIRLFNTFADSVNEGSTIIIEDRMPSDFQRILRRNDISYIWFTRIINDSDSQTQYQTYYCPLDDDLEYSLSGDSFIFHDSGDSNVYHTFDGYHKKDGTWGHGSTSNSFSRTTINEFTVNMSDKIVNDFNCEAIMFSINGHLYDPNALNVEVSFSPALVGDVDRSLTNGTNTALMNQLVMSVQNNSRFAIQYEMYIEKTDKVNLRGSITDKNTYYDDDPVFVYYGNEWIYTIPYDTDQEIWSNEVSNQNKPSQWHYVAANSPDIVIFDFDQINLEEGVNYTVVVKAIRCDFGQASDYFSSLTYDDRIYPELKMLDLDSIETVYSSSFSMLQYSDVHYNPDSSANGVLPYNGLSGISQASRYRMSRSAIQNPDGSINYDDVNMYDDKNSWYNKQFEKNYDVLGQYNNSGSGSSSSEYNNLLVHVSGVYAFITSVLGFFPLQIVQVMNLALWATLFIIIIRRLH